MNQAQVAAYNAAYDAARAEGANDWEAALRGLAAASAAAKDEE